MDTPTPSSIPAPLDIFPNPSDALTAMIDGLLDVENHNNWAVDMYDFGSEYVWKSRQGVTVCYGCAATFTVLKALQTVYDVPISQFDRRRQLGVYWHNFERMIDELRRGGWQELISYFQENPHDLRLRPVIDLRELTNDAWKRRLPLYATYRDQLKDLDL